jgi:uncharacterized surface protein with fasciclin (FAS1) repeats
MFRSLLNGRGSGIAVVVAATLIGSIAVSEASRRTSPNLVERLERSGNFSVLLTALETANLKQTLAEGGPFTLFAPTDRAFEQLLSDLGITAEQLLNNPDLSSILLYHVVAERQRAGALVQTGTVPTLQGQPVLVGIENFGLRVNRSSITRVNVPASNGFIQVIDAVLLPPAEPVTVDSMLDVLQLDGRFTVLLKALEVTGLDDAVASSNPITLFAPTDEAFTALLGQLGITAEQLLANPDLAQILLYHVAGGKNGALELLRAGQIETLQGDDLEIRLRRSGVFVNDSRVINPNVPTPNGLIHTLDAVLLP